MPPRASCTPRLPRWDFFNERFIRQPQLRVHAWLSAFELSRRHLPAHPADLLAPPCARCRALLCPGDCHTRRHAPAANSGGGGGGASERDGAPRRPQSSLQRHDSAHSDLGGGEEKEEEQAGGNGDGDSGALPRAGKLPGLSSPGRRDKKGQGKVAAAAKGAVQKPAQQREERGGGKRGGGSGGGGAKPPLFTRWSGVDGQGGWLGALAAAAAWAAGGVWEWAAGGDVPKEERGVKAAVAEGVEVAVGVEVGRVGGEAGARRRGGGRAAERRERRQLHGVADSAGSLAF